jgi:hypothetical protein
MTKKVTFWTLRVKDEFLKLSNNHNFSILSMINVGTFPVKVI